MPANLTPQYHKAEEAYRRAGSPAEELAALELMLRELPKHKGTDKLQAELKHKISRAKEETQKPKSTGHGAGFRIARQGAGRAVLIGGPNSGKSQLLAALTGARPEIAPYPFTTRDPAPGMMAWEDATVQLIDTPPITADVFDPRTIGLIRGSDLAVLLADLGSDDGIEQLQEVLEQFQKGKTRLARHSSLDEEDIGVSYTRTLFAPNKLDSPEFADRRALLTEFCQVDFEEFPIAAATGEGVEALRNAIYQSLDVVRVYTKSPAKKEPDYERPFTVRRGGTLLDIAEQVHKDLAENLKYARVWSQSAQGVSTVKGDYVVHDKDVVEIHE